MRNNLVVAGLIVLSSGLLRAQFSVRSGAPAAPSGTLTMDDLLTAAKHYFRDTAELPMVQTTTFSVIDSPGRKRKPQSTSTDYLFHGYSRKNATVNSHLTGHSMWAGLGGFKMLKRSANSAFWTMVPGVRLYVEKGDYILKTHIPESGGPILAELTPSRPCAPFTMTKPEYYLPNWPCGPSEFQLTKDLAFQEFSYEASGLPAPIKINPFGRCTLRRYHTDVSFQSVNLPGEDEPFLVPKEVTAALETDKGTIVISSYYQPKPAQKK